MLVLTRKSDESLTLFLPGGGRLLIKIKEITSQSARVAIDAPKDVRIVRTELMSRPGFDPMGPPPPPPSPSSQTQPLPAS